MSSQLAQLLTGHSYLRGHLFRFQLVPSSICQCGEEEETTPHVIISCPCPAVSSARIELRAALAAEEICWPPDLAQLISTSALLRALDAFARSCGRFETPRRAINN